MKRITLILLVLAGAALSSCIRAGENNGPLEYSSLDVNFSASVVGESWSAGDAAAIFATCTRDGVESVAMSESVPARFVPVGEGEKSFLVKAADKDNILSLTGDHNFMFYAFTPWKDGITSVESLPASIPSRVTYGQVPEQLFVAKKSVTGVVAPVDLVFTGIACTVKLKVPADIVTEGTTTLKSMVLRAADESQLTADIAYNATYNLYTDELKVTPSSGSRTITIDFNNLQMEAGYTEVVFMMAPFTVPEDGFELEFTAADGSSNTVPFLSKKAGKTYVVGDVIEETVSNSGDGIIPCASPVLWPVGYVDGVGVFSNAAQPLWLTDHIWTSTQPQATMQYVVSDANPLGSNVKFETNNFKQYNYSAGCVKGSWTGDYFDFIVPVKKVPAGTTVKMTYPAYGRGAPLFWDFEYLDGEEWKCNRTSWTSPDGQFTMDCTLMMEHGNKNGSFEGITYTVNMPLEHEIKSGYIHIRMKVADGRYITVPSSTYSTSCQEKAAPTTDGTTLFAFVNKSGMTKAISIEW